MTDSLRIIVIDDETIIAEFLKTFLEKAEHQVQVFFSADIEFEKCVSEFKPELVFLDINLNSKRSGIDLAKICSQHEIPFIYLTSYSDPKTIELALAHEPISYLLKPFTEKDILVNLEMVKSRIKKNQDNGTLVLRDGYDTIKVDVAEIKWLKADNIYTEIITNQKKFIQRVSLQQIHESLPQNTFIRVHRSYVVNINAISRVASDHVELGEERIPLSRSKKTELLEKLY